MDRTSGTSMTPEEMRARAHKVSWDWDHESSSEWMAAKSIRSELWLIAAELIEKAAELQPTSIEPIKQSIPIESNGDDLKVSSERFEEIRKAAFDHFFRQSDR